VVRENEGSFHRPEDLGVCINRDLLIFRTFNRFMGEGEAGDGIIPQNRKLFQRSAH
jgi:hypothetical protein